MRQILAVASQAAGIRLPGPDYNQLVYARLCSPHLARATQDLAHVSRRTWQGKDLEGLLHRIEAHHSVRPKSLSQTISSSST